MARIRRNSFTGGYRVTGLEHDINKAVRDRQFQQDMNSIGDQVTNIPADAFKGAVRDTAVIGAIGIGMARNKRFRYIMQAILHFPMAFMVVIGFVTGPILGFPSSGEYDVGQVFLIGLIGSIIWTSAYIFFRTRPKLRRLRGH